jgi:hypothetical protein
MSFTNDVDEKSVSKRIIVACREEETQKERGLGDADPDLG